MKDDSTFWIVYEEGKPKSSGIRCDEGKAEAKELRKLKESETGRKWKSEKTTQHELASCH